MSCNAAVRCAQRGPSVAEVAEGLPAGRAAMTSASGEADVDTYITAIGAALNTSREQTLTIIANLDFMDSVAK